MRRIVVSIGMLLAIGSVTYAKSVVSEAHAVLHNAQGEKVGGAELDRMTFPDGSTGVVLALSVHHLPPGEHAVHIHAAGQCDPPDFASAGPHINPYGKKHGLKNLEGHHAGDLPNLVVGPDGTAKIEAVASGVTLGLGSNSLFQDAGTALVIHASPDDDVTDPAGNAGARIACGVITQ